MRESIQVVLRCDFGLSDGGVSKFLCFYDVNIRAKIRVFARYTTIYCKRKLIILEIYIDENAFTFFKV